MRYLILLLFISQIVSAQKKSAVDSIPKGTNLMKVNGVAFRDVVNHLLDVGYTINTIDSNFQTVTTVYKTLHSGFDIMYDIRVKDGVMILKGGCANGDYRFGRVQNLKCCVWKYTFLAMNNFAASFNRPVEYITEKL